MLCKSCGEKPKNTAKDFTKAVIEINNPEQIVLFRKVVIPTSMGDDTVVLPAIGKYHNVLLVYEANNHAYLYSSDGIPTLLTSDVAQDIEEKIDAVAGDLQVEINARKNADIALDNRLTTVEGIAATALQPEAIDKVVMTDISLSPNTSTTTVQIDGAKENLLTGATTTKNVPLPVASHTEAGVMNSSTFDAVASNSNNINALLNGAVAITGLSASPSQSDLTTAWESQTGLTTLMNRAGIYDVTNNKVWTYYSNDNTWYAASNTTQVTINTFTNSSEGTILGSTNVGQIFAESDGTGSVNGWDNLSGNVSTNTSNITSLQTAMAGKQDKLTAGTNITISPTNVISATGTSYTAGNAITIKNNTINADIYPADFFINGATETDTGSNITLHNTIPATLKSIELYGDTKQQTYTGKNLLNLPDSTRNSGGIDWTNSNGTSTGSGIATNTSSLCTNNIPFSLPAGTYTFSIQNTLPYEVQLNMHDGSSWDTVARISSNNSSVTFSTTKTYTQWRMGVVGWTVGTSISLVVKQPMLETGSAPTSYEPYVGGAASPNPDYPQDIHVATGEQTVMVVSKNLVKFTADNLKQNSGSVSTTDMTFGDNYVDFVTNTNVTSVQYAYYYSPELKTENTYTISFDIDKIQNSSNNRFTYSYSEDGTTWSSNYNVDIPLNTGESDSITRSFTGHKYIRFGFYNCTSSGASAGTHTIFKNVQLEVGALATDFESYQSQTRVLDLGTTEVCKLGNYQDYIYKSGDDWYIHKAVGKIVFDGSESWTLSGQPTNYLFNTPLSLSVTGASSPLISENFVWNGSAVASQQNVIYVNSSGRIVFINPTSNGTAIATSTDGWETWLGTHNTTIYYPLATPTDTQITDADLITDLNALAMTKGYLGITNFSVKATGTNLPVLLKPELYAESLESIIEILSQTQDSLSSGGLIVELTEADYDWPENDPDGIAMWKLEDGLYYNTSAKIYKNTSVGSVSLGYHWVVGTPAQKSIYYIGPSGQIAVTSVDPDDGTVIIANTLFLTRNNIVDSLTSTSAIAPLSAKQGNVLSNEIGDLSALQTTAKTDIVAAINELATRIATLEGN